MRRKLLVVTALMGVFGLFAQQSNIADMNAVPRKALIPSENINPIYKGSSHTPTGNAPEGTAGTVIGHTTYDLQSNAAAPNRLIVDGDGNIQVTWTGSKSMAAPEFPDRGSFYRYYNASTSTWTEEPTSRLEGETRTGWPANAIFEDGGEIIVSHDPSTGNYNLIVMKRDVAGTGEWSTPSIVANVGIWPRVAVSGNHVHVIYAHTDGGDDANNYTYYAHSSDKGETWDTVDMALPGVSKAEGYEGMTGDGYAIRAQGSTVAIVSGATYNKGVTLWKSEDNGSTWTSTMILETGLSGYSVDEDSHITDIDGDNVGDTVVTSDEAYELILDKEGNAHVWFGRMVILDNATDAVYSYFPYMSAIMYWNESMGADGATIIDEAIIKDLDQDGEMVSDLGADLPGYGPGIISMPTAAYDSSTGRIYLVYSAMVENSDIEEDPADESAESYRDLYGMVGTGVSTDSVTTTTTYDTTYVFDTTSTTYDTTVTYDTTIVNTDTTIDTITVYDTTYVFDTTSTTYDTTVVNDTMTINSFSWSEPVNLTNTASAHFENVYPSAADLANGQVHITWQRDEEPGHALEAEADLPVTNEIMYAAFDYDDFNVSAPVPNFSDTVLTSYATESENGCRVSFTNTSIGEIFEYSWSFGDGYASSDANPGHTYAGQSIPTEEEFTVCLTVSNEWGDSTKCDTIALTCYNSIEELGLGAIDIYPNPSTGLVNVDLDITNGQDVSVEVANILGSTIYTNNLSNQNGHHALRIDLSNYHNGIYFVKVRVDENVMTKKVTISK